jgi:hypothetical protein
MRDHLAPFEQEIKAMESRSPDVIDAAALLWRLTTHMTLRLRSLHPDWLFYRYEDLAQDPTRAFGDMFQELGLEFTREIRNRIVRTTNPNISAWKKDLSAKEVGALRSMVDELSSPTGAGGRRYLPAHAPRRAAVMDAVMWSVLTLVFVTAGSSPAASSRSSAR